MNEFNLNFVKVTWLNKRRRIQSSPLVVKHIRIVLKLEVVTSLVFNRFQVNAYSCDMFMQLPD